MKRLLPFIFILVMSFSGSAQEQSGSANASSGTVSGSSKIKQVNETTVRDVLKPNGKPLLVNFWATWCVPCREEFPELVKLDQEYKDKIDFITISLDDLAEINRGVPKFLAEMKAEMPTYLLYTNQEDAVISRISKTWQGGLPFTVLYDESGKVVHTRQGIIKPEVVSEKIDQLLDNDEIITVSECVKVLNNNVDDAVFYYKNNWLMLRKKAIERNFISGYNLELPYNGPGSANEGARTSECDIVLQTEYAGRAQFESSEDNFRGLIDKLLPGGPKLKGALKPGEFRKGVSVSTRSRIKN